jgi:putative membrane protein
LANAKQVMLPAEPTAAQKATKDRLARLSGAAFDRAYVSAMVKDHQTAVAEFTKQSKGSDPDVSAFADKMLPALRDHLQRAQAVQKQIGATGTSATSKSSGGAAK